ncbi:hypothetical protein [Vannielia litorea]|uniref:hypothetical protein n=1 Tax=Vannielia litorea TaxID=1217970 RepID=UPI001BD19FF8|nr:hypothetical protein [Vannielia litorea]MBS8228354.1 hypothetical protein [Vannielia litorea]
MPERLFRRLSTSYRRDTRHVALVGLSVAGALALITGALRLTFYALIFQLVSVTIPDHVAGKNPRITVERYIWWDFGGQFSVTIRSAKDHTIVCLSPWTRTFTYRAAAMKGGPELKRPLSYWLGGRDVLARCEGEGFGSGLFYVNTCHRWMLGPLQLAKRCVESNSFLRSEP